MKPYSIFPVNEDALSIALLFQTKRENYSVFIAATRILGNDVATNNASVSDFSLDSFYVGSNNTATYKEYGHYYVI